MTISKEWVILLVFSLITTLAWIGFEVHRAYTTTTIPEVLEEQMAPLNPELDQEALKILRSLSNP